MGVREMFGGMGKNVEYLWVYFFYGLKSRKQKTAPGFSVSTYSHENNMSKISHFDICAREICQNFVYKYLETTEYVKN